MHVEYQASRLREVSLRDGGRRLCWGQGVNRLLKDQIENFSLGGEIRIIDRDVQQETIKLCLR